MPPREKDTSADVNNITLSSERLLTPPSLADQNDLTYVTRKEYWEDNGNFEFMYDNDHYETQDGEARHIPEEGPSAPISPNFLLGKGLEDTKRLEHHSLLPDDCQYNESSGAESKSSCPTEITVLEEPHPDDNAEGPLKLNPGKAIERDEDTLPPRKRDTLKDVNSMTLSSEDLSILPFYTYQSSLPFTSTARKWYREESGEVGCMYDNDQYETQEADHPFPLLINGKFYCALSSEDHNVFSVTALQGIPFRGADLIIMQKQKNWSEEKLRGTLMQICGLNTKLKRTHYIIVAREKDESLTQTLEECTPGGKAYTMYVAWSRMPARAGPGLTDVVEKNCVIFVGPSSNSATNWFVAETEQDFMKHIIKLFVPPAGVVLEFGNSDSQVSSCLKPSVQRNVSLLSVYDDERPVSAFRREAEDLSHTAYEGSGFSDNEE